MQDGDRKLRVLLNRLGKVADKSFARNLNKVLSEEALTQVAFGFRRSRDPYGEAWEPLKYDRPRGGNKPLVDTGRMRNSFSAVNVDADGFEIGTNVEYMTHHQYGTADLPQRMMLPIEARGLGPIWTRAFQAQFRELTREHFKK